VDGRPVFAWRAKLSAVAPTGSVNEQRNINQGCGFWAVNPFVAATWVPLPKLEFSSRIIYQYNFRTSTMQSPPPIPGLVYRDGQAGQIVYGNFATSLAVLPNAYVGLNSYALGQLTPNLTNGKIVSHSRETMLSAGPGGRYVFNESNTERQPLFAGRFAERHQRHPVQHPVRPPVLTGCPCPSTSACSATDSRWSALLS
jgi:hypothetical protein